MTSRRLRRLMPWLRSCSKTVNKERWTVASMITVVVLKDDGATDALQVRWDSMAYSNKEARRMLHASQRSIWRSLRFLKPFVLPSKEFPFVQWFIPQITVAKGLWVTFDLDIFVLGAQLHNLYQTSSAATACGTEKRRGLTPVQRWETVTLFYFYFYFQYC